MGHWLGADRRETLVREVAREFSFAHQDVNLNLKFWQELEFARKPDIAKAIAAQIRSGQLDWDIICLDEDMYALIASDIITIDSYQRSPSHRLPRSSSYNIRISSAIEM